MNIPNELRQLLERIPLQLLIENGYNQTAAQLRILLAQPAAQTGVGTGFDYSITTTTSNSLAQRQRHMEAAREQIAQRDAKLAQYAELLRELRCLPDSYHMIDRIDAALAAAGVEE